MSAVPARRACPDEDLLNTYAQHGAVLRLTKPAQGDRNAAARAFLTAHPDLTVWMSRPLTVRLTDLDRSPLAWPLVTFAVLSGRVAVDFDLLAAKHAGRSFATAVVAIYPQDMTVLRAATSRLNWAEPWVREVLRHSPPVVVAATGRAPNTLSQADIDAVRDAVRSSPYYTPAVRRSRLSHLHSLARLLYEARIIDVPPIHRRGDGPGDLESRLSVVAAAEIRRVLLGYLNAKQAVLKDRSIRNLTSHLAAFGEFLTEHDPAVTALPQLQREHIEAYCVFVQTRRWRGQRACDQQIGAHSLIAGLVAVRGFLDDITAWGWADAPQRRLMFTSDVPRPPRHLPVQLAQWHPQPGPGRAVVHDATELEVQEFADAQSGAA